MLTKLEHILLLMGFQPQPAVFKWNTIQTSLDKSVVKRPSPITAPPSAFAAMLERHSSFCTEMMRWPHLSRWDQLRMVVGVAVFSALSTVFTSRLWRLMMDQTQFQSQFRIVGFSSGFVYSSLGLIIIRRTISTAAFAAHYLVQFCTGLWAVRFLLRA